MELTGGVLHLETAARAGSWWWAVAGAWWAWAWARGRHRSALRLHRRLLGAALGLLAALN